MAIPQLLSGVALAVASRRTTTTSHPRACACQRVWVVLVEPGDHLLLDGPSEFLGVGSGHDAKTFGVSVDAAELGEVLGLVLGERGNCDRLPDRQALDSAPALYGFFERSVGHDATDASKKASGGTSPRDTCRLACGPLAGSRPAELGHL